MIIDILVLLVLAVSALIAFLRGFIREVLTIVGVLGGMAAAYYGGPYFLPLMEGWLNIDPNAEDPQKLFDVIPYTYVASFLAYGSIFVVVVIILSVISHMIAEAVKSVGLGAIDRSLGVVFGLVRGILLLGILYLPVFLTIDEDVRDGWFEGSRSHIYIEMTAEAIAGFLPEQAKSGIEKQVSEGSEAVKGETRKALEGMDLLKRNDQGAPQEGPNKGYSDRQREEMDRLFEDFDSSNESLEER